MAGLNADGIASTRFDCETISGTTVNYTSGNIAAVSGASAIFDTVSGTNAQLGGYAMIPLSGGGLAVQGVASTIITGGMWVESISGTTRTFVAGTAAAYPRVVGVALATAASGATVNVQVAGVAFMRANGTITINDYLQKGAGGALDGVVAAGSATVQPAYIVGRSLNTAASGTTSFVPVLLG